MGALVVDTHTAIWYLHMDPSLSRAAEAALDEAFGAGYPVYLPSMCLVELTYLVEKGRLPATALDRMRQSVEQASCGFLLAELDLRVVDSVRLLPRDQVPDLPDRVIAATSMALGLPLVTCDSRIRSLPIPTIW
ncbi:MAG: type II toxin-antitoxin system VapC family toxin [Candidatus Hydrogenedentes bacterium]|nr:type II toxin-antitoxin system VapC family toxin [Candidatus Hydrogenedentota bacterium]